MKEKLTPVTSEAQLRPGLLVETRDCYRCSRSHRNLLLRCSISHANCSGCFRPESWEVAPSGHGPEGDACFCRAIPERRLFIVESGLDAAEDAIEGYLLYNSPRAKERAR